ncbi:hypothetical protein [Streptomyces sp. NRRL S-350]|uniref:hypothetical protein n=1 Tax=Streptomyces sp. NRRL S-350 TaxID=1463902 RepID=UPI0004BEF68D|nr:hypothetical protein [Streptomyces sp. NRRL S-350]
MPQRDDRKGQGEPIDEVSRLLASVSEPMNPMILLDGPPLSGISRSMYEGLQRTLPQARLAQFTARDLARTTAQPGFVSQFSGGDRYVLWLDGLTPADLVLLGSGVLDKILPHAMVLASVDTAWRDRLLADTSPATAPARTVLLEYAHCIKVPFALTARERNYLREKGYPVSKGIAESLVGGENLVRHYHRAARSTPDGHLLVQAAIDVRRCGIHRPLTEDELYRLWCSRTDHDNSRPLFERALHWASTVPDGSSTGLLYRAAGGTSPRWRVLAYAAGADDGNHGHKTRPLGAREWNEVAQQLPESGDQYDLGIAAHLHGRSDTAITALTQAARAADAGHPAAEAAETALHHLRSATG